MVNGERLTIEVKPRDSKGRHLVVASVNGTTFKNRIDLDSQFHRSQCRESMVSRFGLPDDSHEFIESELIAKGEAADSRSESSLWTPSTVCLADVEAKPTHWFWDKTIPKGAFSILDADPNEGKTTISIDIGARFTNGFPMPPHPTHFGGCESGSVLFMGAEDDVHRTVAPRFAAAGADMSRVHYLRSVNIDGEDERIIQLPRDTPIIESEIVRLGIGFVIVDVLAAFVQPGISMNDDGAMRQLTTPLANMFERTQATGLLLRHLNKKENLRGMYRGGGSIAINAAARAAFAIAPHPDDDTMKVWAAVKHNLGPKPPSLAFTIEPHEGSTRIAWGEQTDFSAADILKGQSSMNAGNKTDQAAAIISDVLSGGPRGENEVKSECERAGISGSTYWRARRKLKVVSEKSGFGAGWILSLPSDDCDIPD